MKRGILIGVIAGVMFLSINVPRAALAQDYGHWWDRWTSASTDSHDLEGTWYANGERDKRTEIVSTRRGLQARNEFGRTTRLDITRNGDVRALDWERGLRGDVRRGRIDWENGTVWTREPSYRYARRR
jgi:hypothetical protein